MMKILIIDDHRLFLEGLKAVINAWPVNVTVLTAETLSDAFKLIEENQDLDIVLSDMKMAADAGGLALLEWLRERSTLPVLVVSASERLDDVKTVLNAGANGYVPKTAAQDDLYTAVTDVLAGGIFLPKAWHSKMSANDDSLIVFEGDDQIMLSPRMQDMLLLIKEGYKNFEIAEMLEISENTVKAYIKDLFQRLNVNSRVDCLAAAQRLSLFEQD